MTFSWDLVYTVTVGGCWAIFCLVWAAGAIYNALHAPPAEQRRAGLNAWLVGVVLIVAARGLVPQQLWAALTFDTPLLRVVGVALLLVSTVFTLWARFSLGTMWTSSAVVKREHQLRTSGPYAITRHPIYTGVLGMLTGTLLMSGVGVWIGYLIVGVAVLATKAAAEEGLLLKRFGDRYRAYRERVPALVPGSGRLRPRHWPARPSSQVS
jgi:protein-S-isoprenylcysteine O-methyltransferase Ste14